MTVSPALLCALSCAAAATPLLCLLSAERRRHRLTRETLALVTGAGEIDRTARLRAEVRLDTIHDQHVRAGRASHRADEERQALCARTLDRLRIAAPNPPRPRAEIEAEVAALRAARKASNPLDAVMGVPANSTAGEGEILPPPSSFRRGSAARPLLNCRG